MKKLFLMIFASAIILQPIMAEAETCYPEPGVATNECWKAPPIKSDRILWEAELEQMVKAECRLDLDSQNTHNPQACASAQNTCRVNYFNCLKDNATWYGDYDGDLACLISQEKLDSCSNPETRVEIAFEHCVGKWPSPSSGNSTVATTNNTLPVMFAGIQIPTPSKPTPPQRSYRASTLFNMDID